MTLMGIIEMPAIEFLSRAVRRSVQHRGPDIRYRATTGGSGRSFKVRKAQPLFRTARPTRTQFDVTPDGNRFVFVTQDPINPKLPLTLVQNWTALLGNKP